MIVLITMPQINPLATMTRGVFLIIPFRVVHKFDGDFCFAGLEEMMLFCCHELVGFQSESSRFGFLTVVQIFDWLKDSAGNHWCPPPI